MYIKVQVVGEVVIDSSRYVPTTLEGEIIDASVMEKAKEEFYRLAVRTDGATAWPRNDRNGAVRIINLDGSIATFNVSIDEFREYSDSKIQVVRDMTHKEIKDCLQSIFKITGNNGNIIVLDKEV